MERRVSGGWGGSSGWAAAAACPLECFIGLSGRLTLGECSCCASAICGLAKPSGENCARVC